jgi:hypothetical protein
VCLIQSDPKRGEASAPFSCQFFVLLLFAHLYGLVYFWSSATTTHPQKCRKLWWWWPLLSFFGWAARKKTKSTDNKGESKSSEWGKKMRKEKSGARTLGLWERAIKDHERVREGKKKEESFWAIISILYAPLRQHLTMGSDRNEKRGANFHHRWDWDGERERVVFFLLLL